MEYCACMLPVLQHGGSFKLDTTR